MVRLCCSCTEPFALIQVHPLFHQLPPARFNRRDRFADLFQAVIRPNLSGCFSRDAIEPETLRRRDVRHAFQGRCRGISAQRLQRLPVSPGVVTQEPLKMIHHVGIIPNHARDFVYLVSYKATVAACLATNLGTPGMDIGFVTTRLTARSAPLWMILSAEIG